MGRFRSQFTKLFHRQLEGINERDYAGEPEFKEMFAFIGVEPPEAINRQTSNSEPSQGQTPAQVGYVTMVRFSLEFPLKCCRSSQGAESSADERSRSKHC